MNWEIPNSKSFSLLIPFILSKIMLVCPLTVAACKECRSPTLEYQNGMISDICQHLAMQSTLFFSIMLY